MNCFLVLRLWGLRAAGTVLVLLVSYQGFAQQPFAVPLPLTVLSSSDSLAIDLGQHEPIRVHRSCMRPLFVPSLLLGAGALMMAERQVLETDEELHEEIREHMARPTTTIDNQLRYLPGVATLGLGLAGVKGRHTPVDQLMLGALTYSINDAVTSHLKKLTHVQRPDGSNYHSFPSQHTSTAFAAATFLHQEYGGRSLWYSIGGYSVAATTGGMRMVKDAHWLSDVLAGAGIGILSTEAAYWLYPHLQRPLQRMVGRHAMVLPNYQLRAAGLTAVVVL
ncbi:phosphatase PAP2 family protein [Hymenobacter sp. BT730]|uniref:phosphatase PAP2 family protein n=1 Tax=Hymenobacter sp. BT730 TaxID=3063332 RepID=UPI0026E03152|nr:phosphatase PAP2 family protein [Hymenobacter sp. BT730]